MARYGAGHKEATRRRMVETAGRRFKADGIDGSGIATLVADAGLTNGAFYGHFPSKDDLVAAVVADQMAAQVTRIDALPAGAGVEAFVREYLSTGHRDDVAAGCPSAALLDEIGRCGDAARRAYTDGARSVVAAIARRLDDTDSPSPAAEGLAVALMGLLVGSLQMARALDDADLSARTLDAATVHALALLADHPHPTPPTTSEEAS